MLRSAMSYVAAALLVQVFEVALSIYSLVIVLHHALKLTICLQELISLAPFPPLFKTCLL